MLRSYMIYRIVVRDSEPQCDGVITCCCLRRFNCAAVADSFIARRSTTEGTARHRGLSAYTHIQSGGGADFSRRSDPLTVSCPQQFKVYVDLHSAFLRKAPQMRSDINRTVLPANYSMPAFTPQPHNITALWLVLILRSHGG